MTYYELINKQTYFLVPLKRTTGRKDGNASIVDGQKLRLSPLDDTIDAGRKSHCVRVKKMSEKSEQSVDMVTLVYILHSPAHTGIWR